MSNGNRYYPIDGKQMISVTSVIKYLAKPALYGFYAKFGWHKAKEIAEYAANTGTAAHSYIEKFIADGEKPEIDITEKNLVQAIQNFHDFDKRYKPDYELSEVVLHHPEFKYAGTADGVMLVNNELILFDWKTSSDIYPEYELQLNAYYQALTEMQKAGIIEFKGEVTSLWAIRLSKNSKIDFRKDIKKYKPNDEAFQAFLGLLDVHNWIEKRRKK